MIFILAKKTNAERLDGAVSLSSARLCGDAATKESVDVYDRWIEAQENVSLRYFSNRRLCVKSFL